MSEQIEGTTEVAACAFVGVPWPLDEATVARLAKRAREVWWDELDDPQGWEKVVRAVIAALMDDPA